PASNCYTHISNFVTSTLAANPPIISVDVTSEVSTATARSQLEARQILEDIQQKINKISASMPEFGAQLKAIQDQLGTLTSQQNVMYSVKVASKAFRSLHDSLYAQILANVEANLVGSTYSGPSVRRSDILLDSNLMSATILYRNYKPSLRHLPALDPA